MNPPQITQLHPIRSTATRLVIVGDIHNQWSHRDVVALKALLPDMTLFVGDIGNEAVSLVQQIAAMKLPKTVILGNHDAFFTHKPLIRSNLKRPMKMDPVNTQLDALGEDHIGFGSRDLFGKPVTIIGARPFTSGGQERYPKLIENIYDIKSSVERYARIIVRNVVSTPITNAVVILGHNGPAGLGSKRHDICGVDFRSEEGDHGDLDLQRALETLKEQNRSPALVTFGHMHSSLRPPPNHRALVRKNIENEDLPMLRRRRVIYDPETNTVFLNAAVVPRVSVSDQYQQRMRHHFCLAEIELGQVVKAEDVYVWMHDESVEDITSEVLFEREVLNDAKTVRVYNTHLKEWENHVFSIS